MRINKVILIMFSLVSGANIQAAAVPPGVAKDYLDQHVIGKAFCATSEGRLVGLHFSTSWTVSIIDSLAGMPSPFSYFKLTPEYDGISGEIKELWVANDQELLKVGKITFREGAPGQEGELQLGADTGPNLGLPSISYRSSQCPN